MAEVERTRKMNHVKLKKGDNPAKLFEQIKVITNEFSDLTNALTKDVKIIAERISGIWSDFGKYHKRKRNWTNNGSPQRSYELAMENSSW